MAGTFSSLGWLVLYIGLAVAAISMWAGSVTGSAAGVATAILSLLLFGLSDFSMSVTQIEHHLRPRGDRATNVIDISRYWRNAGSTSNRES